MNSENQPSMIGDDNDKWTTISIAQQQQQPQQSSTIQPFFTRSTCSHTILNSPSSSCRLHVVNLNRSSSSTINNHRSSLGAHTNSKSSEWFLSRQSSMPTTSSHYGISNKNHQKSSVSTPTNATELSSISSPQSPPSTICPPPLRFANTNTPRKNNSLRSHPHSRYFQSPMLSKSSSTRTSLSNTINFVPPPPQFTSTDWLKFGFKILLLFTVLFWLFSIVTWMSIMPKTMPISLTIITSMMTIGLIISLVIQSEWPYSFEFIPNVEDFTGIDDSSDDSDANDHDNLMTNKANNHRNNTNNDNVNRMAPHRKPNHNKTGYKNISNPNNQDNSINKNKKKNSETCKEESTDSGLGNSNGNGNEITVIQIDDD